MKRTMLVYGSGILVTGLSLSMPFIQGCNSSKQPTNSPFNGNAVTAPGISSQPALSTFNSPYLITFSGEKIHFPVGKEVLINWLIIDKATDRPLKSFLTVHEKKAHLFIVSEDLKTFSHLHPQINGSGAMSVETVFPAAGYYRFFLQFATEQGEQTLVENLQAGHGLKHTAYLIPDSSRSKTIAGYTYRLSGVPTQAGKASMLNLQISKNGKPVTFIEPYLGAGGHCVILNEEASELLHVHPLTKAGVDGYYRSPLQFHTVAPKPGLYKLWIQSQIEGKIQTVDFSFRVD